MPTSPVIYEVNLVVNNSILEQFQKWLPGHIRELTSLPGFERVQMFERKTEEEGASSTTTLLTLHYHLSSREHLENYFNTHAERLRTDGISRFANEFSASRRILYPGPELA